MYASTYQDGVAVEIFSMLSSLSTLLSKKSIPLVHPTRGPGTHIVMLGLSNTGKTTILYQLKLNEAITTFHTYTYNKETIQLQSGS